MTDNKKTMDIALYFFTFLTIQLLTQVGVTNLLPWTSWGVDGMVVPLIVSMALSGALTVGIFCRMGWCRVSPNWLRTRPWAVMIWSSMVAVGAIVPSIWLQEQLPQLPNLAADELNMIMKNRWGYVVIGLLVPLVEEMVFRGAIQRRLLERMAQPWMAVVIGAMLFALAHFNPAQLPHAFLVGLVLGWMYHRTGSILPGVALHWVNNSMAYVMVNILPQPDEPLVLLFGSEERVGLALFFSGCILVPSLLQLANRMKRAEENEKK